MTEEQPLPIAAGGGKTVFGMGACYALGTFTDNFYKQCAILLAASLHLPAMQSYATILFSLPFILFSAWAGWLADRIVKRNIVVAAKLIELAALAGGTFALVAGAWWGILLVLFCMGLQGTFFSPALNGSIPEHFPGSKVPRVNSFIKLASTAAVLIGIAAAGIFMDIRPGGADPAQLPLLGQVSPEQYGRAVAGAFVVVMAVAGVIAAFSLRKPPQVPGRASHPFPFAGPVDSLRHFWEYRKDPQLFLVLLAEGFFYGVAAIAVISVNNLSKSLGYSDTVTSLLSAVLMIGIAVGAVIAGRREAESWRRLLAPAATGMGLFMLLTAAAPLMPGRQEAAGLLQWADPQIVWLVGTLFSCGVCGGIYLIPLASFIQVRPGPGEKGKVLGISNFFSFVAIAVFGVFFYAVSVLPPALNFLVYGAVTLVFAAFTGRRIASFIGLSIRDISATPLSLFLRGILALRYQVEENGLQDVAAQYPSGKGTLFLPNHPALIDPFIVYSRIAALRPRPLADTRQMQGPVRGLAAKALNAILIPDIRRDGRQARQAVLQGIEETAKALEAGDNALLYPSGRLYRSSKERLGANAAVYAVLKAVPDARVVLVRTSGLWGSRFSYASGKEPGFFAVLGKGFAALLAGGIFFAPKRRVSITFIEAEDLPKTNKTELNRYLEEFYNEAENEALEVPLTRFFKKG